ncbi:MAG TPA: TolC family protein [Kofleriaceae bacterium]|jgi:outer membrane protein TolC|nr:TolC family protein [Kofleriaceae bacterium]
MNRFTLLVAAVLGALSSAAAAQPRGRAPADSDSDAPAASPDGDGPEATNVAKFRLDDIIEAAIRLSPDIARARTDREIGLETAEAATKDQSWILQAGANGEIDAIGADTTGLEPLQVIKDSKVTAQMSLGRNLPTGGNISFEVGVTHEEKELNVTGDVLDQAQQMQPDCGTNVDVFCQNQAIAKLTYKQPLARGIGSDVALAPSRKAELSAVEATVKAQLAAEEMIKDIVSAYWDLAYAAYEVDVRAEALEAAREQDRLTRQEMRAGTASQNSLDSVTYELAVRDEALLTSKLAFEQKSLELRRKAGLEIGRRDIVVRPADPLEIDNSDWNVDDVLAKSHKVNRQIASLVIEKKIADVDVDVAHNGLLPQIDLNLSGALTGTGATAGDSFGGVGGGNGFGYQVVAGLSMSFELSGSARAAHNAAVAKRRQVDITRIDTEHQIDSQVVSSVRTLVSDKTRIALMEKAIRIANENLKAERANFMASRSTNFQVMQRQTQVLEAELKRGRAVADHRIAVAQLQYLSGTLLDAYRVHVRGSSETSSITTDDSAAPAPRAARTRSARTARADRAARDDQ